MLNVVPLGNIPNRCPCSFVGGDGVETGRRTQAALLVVLCEFKPSLRRPEWSGDIADLSEACHEISPLRLPSCEHIELVEPPQASTEQYFLVRISFNHGLDATQQTSIGVEHKGRVQLFLSSPLPDTQHYFLL